MLRLIKSGPTLSSGAQIDPRVTTVEGLQLTLQLVTDGLSLPTDIQFVPDGSILIAERGGTVRVIRDGALQPQPALDLSGDLWLPEGGLLAIAVDPKFNESRFVYTLTAAKVRGGELEFMFARYRSVGDRLGERAVLLDRIAASARGAGGALRIGPDGKIYLALDDAANGRTAGSLASYNGKVLRLNADATTPDDRASFSPIYSLDHPLPLALDWQPSSGAMWVVDGLAQASGRLRSVNGASYALPEGTGAASAAFYRGNLIPVFRDNLFIAADAGRHLIRFQFDPKNSERIIVAERLMQDQIGAVRVVAIGPDEALYVASETALFRLAP
jgi:glucose/arabinose dehydrogenase